MLRFGGEWGCTCPYLHISSHRTGSLGFDAWLGHDNAGFIYMSITAGITSTSLQLIDGKQVLGVVSTVESSVVDCYSISRPTYITSALAQPPFPANERPST